MPEVDRPASPPTVRANEVTETKMVQRLHLVFGGELVDPSRTVFRNVDDIHVVGIFPDYESAYNAWKSEAQRTVDDAHTRYFIAHLHRLRDEDSPAGATEELG